MLYRVRQHDVHPRELPELEFTIVAAHPGGLAAAVDRLLEIGIELSQIRFAYNPKADHANVVLTPEKEPVRIEWNTSTGALTHSLGRDFEDLGSIVTRLAAGTRQ
jgi:hypothetical protein